MGLWAQFGCLELSWRVAPALLGPQQCDLGTASRDPHRSWARGEKFSPELPRGQVTRLGQLNKPTFDGVGSLSSFISTTFTTSRPRPVGTFSTCLEDLLGGPIGPSSLAGNPQAGRRLDPHSAAARSLAAGSRRLGWGGGPCVQVFMREDKSNSSPRVPSPTQ